MHTYELTLVFKAGLTDDQVDTIIDGFPVEVTGRQKWGKRLLAYPIQDEKEGTYLLCTVNAERKRMDEFSRKLNINENILRYLVIAQ